MSVVSEGGGRMVHGSEANEDGSRGMAEGDNDDDEGEAGEGEGDTTCPWVCITV